MTPNLSIIIPAYNEEERIPKTLNSYLDYLKGKINFEILVIINGCTDNTLGVVKKIAQKNKEVKYVDIGKVASKGIAVTEGFKLADSELIGFVDADLATPPNAFYDLVQNIENYDAVIASRWMKNSKINKSQPLTRIIAGRSFNILVNLLFNLKLKDTQHYVQMLCRDAQISALPNQIAKVPLSEQHPNSYLTSYGSVRTRVSEKKLRMEKCSAYAKEMI